MATFGEDVSTQLFQALASQGALVSVNYLALPEPVIDPITGNITQSGTSATYLMRLRDFRRTEVDGTEVISGDRQALLPVPSFTGTPTIRDVLSVAGTTFEVKGISKSANEGCWCWHLRKVGEP